MLRVSMSDECIFVRHAETNYNVEGRISSDPLDTSCVLSPGGEAQAAAVRELLADERFDLCVTSQLLRARQTAAAAVGDAAIPTMELADLNDVHAGVFNGRSAADYVEWLTGVGAMGTIAPTGGESLREAVARYVRAFDWILQCSERRLLVVTHALPIALVVYASAANDPPPPEILVGLFAQQRGRHGLTETIAHATPYAVTASDLRNAIAYWRA